MQPILAIQLFIVGQISARRIKADISWPPRVRILKPHCKNTHVLISFIPGRPEAGKPPIPGNGDGDALLTGLTPSAAVRRGRYVPWMRMHDGEVETDAELTGRSRGLALHQAIMIIRTTLRPIPVCHAGEAPRQGGPRRHQRVTSVLHREVVVWGERTLAQA